MSDRSILDEIGADVVLFNGKVVTVDEDDSIFEAVAIKDGRSRYQ